MKYVLLLFLLFAFGVANAQLPADLETPVKITTYPDSAKVKFEWNDLLATQVRIYRKAATVIGWNNPIVTILPPNNTFTDTVTLGKRYEYYVRVTRAGAPAETYNYFAVGINADAIHYKGKALLLVDSTMAAPLQADIAQLKLDLICEGWMVSQVNVSPLDSVPLVRDKVIAHYNTDPFSHHALFILGHVPVPYSGELNPDGHPDHLGAWPTDLYYADVDNTWTDQFVNNVSASRAENRNIPGDGKFDPWSLPGELKIAAGRADFYDMPVFGLSDTLLLKRYLAKDHNYRTKAFTARLRALVDDNFGFFGGEAFAQNGWRNGNALLGNDSVMNADFIADAAADSYLWAYGCGGGNYQGANGIGSTGNFVSDSLKSVFTMLFGSYFGDWDNQNSFLRAPLAAQGYALTNCWAGRSNWFFHTMGMGIPISYSILLTQYNIDYNPPGYGAGFIHNSFMGDPTLTLNPILQPSALVINQNLVTGNVELNWTASADDDVLGYYVYRSIALTDSFTCITPQYTATTSYIDVAPDSGHYVYMVRPVKLQNTVTGSYYNAGIGIVDSVEVVNLPDYLAEIPMVDFSVYPNPSTGVFTIKTDKDAMGSIELFTATGSLVLKQTIIGSATQLDLTPFSNGVYLLKVNAGNKLAGYKKLLKIGERE